ncbi:hypothetical protein LUZ60_016048 [Juncus effusus]|nr:hypothetical protein LUZ60_016048 [Juncus effusus]
MITEKPTWVKHEGLQIFSIDIQPGGLRFATGGGDQKVRIWDMKSIGEEETTETLNPNTNSKRLLATIRDHFGSVNCVRWARHGRYLASGSDDHMILIHERKPGSATVEFGSGEPPDLENWKVVMTLRGHTADVVDLNWSPDDSTLASGSLDNTVHIWSAGNGMCTAVLRGHSSLVKGVAWDPIGSFLISQSDDKSVIIWRTSDWSMAHRTEGHWSKTVGSTFFRRLSWSPCGHYITTTHGFQKPRHSAPVLERGNWTATFDFLGHNAPVVVVKFNHTLFLKAGGTGGLDSVAGGWTNGKGTAGGESHQPYNVIAIGSQDRTITVWTTASARPLFVAKHFFSQSVVDLSWSPDGYTLFACSLDGSAAVFHFDVKELGHRLTDAELDELKRSRYGDVRGGRQANLAESPAQLLLEAVSAKQKKASCAPANHVPPPVQKVPEVVRNESEKSKGSTEPVKQREYRRPDGRKRIIPEAVGVPQNQETNPNNNNNNNNIINNANNNSMGDFGMPALNQRMIGEPVRDPQRTGTTSRAYISETLVVQKAPEGEQNTTNVERSGNLPFAPCNNGSLSISIQDEGTDSEERVKLEAKLVERSINDIVGLGGGNRNGLMSKETQINCTQGSKSLWSDRISAKVTVLAGNLNFFAVGCEDGCLQVYTRCGRRMMPAMMLGSGSVFIDCDASWRLLVVTGRGVLYVWDLFTKSCLLQDSLSSLLPSPSKDSGMIKVISAKFSKCGSPLIVLATRHAFLYDSGMKCWLRIADDCFPASNFATCLDLKAGELAKLQVEAGKFMARKPIWNRLAGDEGVQTRAHLESQLASALALKSPNEYRQCLLSYVRFLTREADESRLREVCESFLGPPIGMLTDPNNPAWDPIVLGIEKHKLLREDILPAMASNRKVQRLLNEFMDLLTEYEANENKTDEINDGDKMEVVPPSNNADANNVVT